MATPVNASYTEEFVLRADRETENHTTFIIGVLDSLLRIHIDDEHTTLSKLQNGVRMSDKEIHHKYLDLVRFGLRGWINFKRSDGSDVPFKTERVEVPRLGNRPVVTDETLAQLDAVDLMEIGMRISQLNTISREQRKN